MPQAHTRDAADGARKRRFEELIAGQTDSLYRTALTLTRSREDAEDLVQETLVKAWRSLESFRQGENPRGWLTAILVNTSRDRYRKKKLEPQVASLETVGLDRQEDARDPGALSAATLEDSVLTQAISDPVLHAIKNLPAAYKEALLLVDLEGFTYREAAEILGTLTGTVMSRLHRARRHLSRDLAAYIRTESPGPRAPVRKHPGPEQALEKTRLISCGDACRHLHAYVDGVLDEVDVNKIDEHLAVCRRCCDRYDFERRQKALLTVHHLGTSVPRTLLRRLEGLIAQF